MRDVDDWLEQNARYMAEAIDAEIIEEMQRQLYMEKGWVRAPFTTDKFSWPLTHYIADVAAWMHINTTDEYRIFGKEFWFKSEKDLTAFILKFG